MTTTVTSGSRLHFGLTRVKPGANVGCLNGVGVMIEYPRVEMVLRPSVQLCVKGSDRIQPFAKTWMHAVAGKGSPDVEIELLSGPPLHSGFGSGTQLAQAVALGLQRTCGVGIDDREEQARLVAKTLDRGNRSMIGSYGFARGGLIVDATNHQGNSVLANRTELPDSWRVVVAVPRQVVKKFGLQEQAAFATIQADDPSRALRLEQLIERQLVPAAEAGDFDEFSETVFEYGKLSGEYYTSVQGGIYNGPVITAVVESLLKLNARGVGQSSWGPAVFAWCEHPSAADELLARLPELLGQSVELFSSPVRNQPAVVHHVCHPVKSPSTKSSPAHHPCQPSE